MCGFVCACTVCDFVLFVRLFSTVQSFTPSKSSNLSHAVCAVQYAWTLWLQQCLCVQSSIQLSRNTIYYHTVLTICGILTVLIEIFIGVPADQGILCVVVNRDARSVLQVIHTLTRSAKRQSRKCESLYITKMLITFRTNLTLYCWLW